MADGMINTFQQAPHPVLPEATHDEASRQDFAKSLRQFVQSTLLPGLKPVFTNRVSRQLDKKETVNRHSIRKVMTKDVYFQHYASTNRIAQELMWESVNISLERQLPELIEKADEISSQSSAPLEFSADFKVPNYVSAIDIHCMPGGYASSEGETSVTAGLLYDRGVYLYAMGYMGPHNDDLGRSVANYVRRNLPDFKPKRILDMGCTVGHSTVPFKELFPDAEVIGIDVAAPQIRYAHARAAGMGYDVGFMQRDASDTGFEDESFDLIVSHILLHETSGKAMPKVFEECYRLLKPGGYMIHADLPPFDKMDPFSQFILDNETYYNNEPFWGAMREVDQIALSKRAGFDEANVRFDTAPMAIMDYAQSKADGYSDDAAKRLSEREFEAGEYAPGGGWEVLIGYKE